MPPACPIRSWSPALWTSPSSATPPRRADPRWKGSTLGADRAHHVATGCGGLRMFERFTHRARRVVVLAQGEARLLDHNYIGTEHLLLGLIAEGEGVGARALQALDVSLPSIRAQIEEIIGRGQTQPTGHIPFTPRAKKVLELSLREALQLGHNYIG